MKKKGKGLLKDKPLLITIGLGIAVVAVIMYESQKNGGSLAGPASGGSAGGTGTTGTSATPPPVSGGVQVDISNPTPLPANNTAPITHTGNDHDHDPVMTPLPAPIIPAPIVPVGASPGRPPVVGKPVVGKPVRTPPAGTIHHPSPASPARPASPASPARPASPASPARPRGPVIGTPVRPRGK